jgi:hypothetical protein
MKDPDRFTAGVNIAVLVLLLPLWLPVYLVAMGLLTGCYLIGWIVERSER